MKTQLAQLLFMLLIAFFCIASQSPPQPAFSSHSSFSGKGFASKIEKKTQRLFQSKIPKESITKHNSPPIQSEKLSVYALSIAIVGAVIGIVAIIMLYFGLIGFFLAPWLFIYTLLLLFFGAILAIVAAVGLIISFVLAIISMIKQAKNPSEFKKSRKGFLVFPLLLLSLAVGLGINALLASLALPIIGLIVGIVLFAGLMYALFAKRKADNKN